MRNSLNSLYSFVESSPLPDVLHDGVFERLSSELLLYVLSLSTPGRLALYSSKDQSRRAASARTLEADRTVPTTLKPASKKDLTTQIPMKPEAPETRIYTPQPEGNRQHWTAEG